MYVTRTFFTGRRETGARSRVDRTDRVRSWIEKFREFIWRKMNLKKIRLVEHLIVGIISRRDLPSVGLESLKLHRSRVRRVRVHAKQSFTRFSKTSLF